MHELERLDTELELQPVLGQLAHKPQFDLAYNEDVEARLPALVGAITISLARTCTTLTPSLKNLDTDHWERATRIFDMLL